MQKIKRHIKRINDSISGKITAGFVLVLLIVISIVVFTYISNLKAKEMYSDTLGVSIMYSDLFLMFEDTSRVLHKCSENGDADNCNEYYETYPRLLAASERMNQTLNPNRKNRMLTDFNYMIQTYTETGVVMADNLLKKRYANAVEYMTEVRKVEQLIGEQYRNINKEVMAYSVEKEKEADGFYKSIMLFNIALLIAGIIACQILIRYITIAIANPISKLKNAVSEYSLDERGQGIILDKADFNTSDEIGVLADAFISMQHKINQQYQISLNNVDLKRKIDEDEVELLRTEKLMRESQLKALQAQINPHFLFNTLNLISNTAYFENAEQTARLMEALGNLMRYNMDNFNKTVHVHDELGCVEDYVTIQKKRFGDRIFFDIHCDEEVKEGKIPCLIIQPLLENAVVHGVGSYTEGGKVGVYIKRSNDRIVIVVYDNGVGISDDQMRKIQGCMSLDWPEVDETSIGLSNVFKRLKLFYEEDVSIKVTSNPNIYTEFCINIPYII
jgi:sensor histidine kinase YesM